MGVLDWLGGTPNGGGGPNNPNDPLGFGIFSLTSLLSLVEPSPLIEIIEATPPPIIREFPASCPEGIPAGINSTAVRSFSLDEGHSARFTVFGAGSSTLGFDEVFETEEPFSYIHSHLGYGAMNPDELCIFSPGLNTPHSDDGDGIAITNLSAPMRIGQYTNVLGFGMAHLHTGTQIDQEDAIIFPVSSNLTNLLFDNEIIPAEFKETVVDLATLRVESADFDKVQVTLSKYNLIDTPLKVAIRQMVDRAVENWEEGRTDEPRLVFMMYSRASIEVSAALRTWKRQAERDNRCNGDVEACLRDAVTVVTIGNGDRNYPDGPAYVHLAMNQDKLTNKLGVSGARPKGGGADAVYLNADSPYSSEANDAHNFAVNTAQYLDLMMRYNKVKGLRELYDLASVGEMGTPENVNELVTAMIVATNCKGWIWKPELALKDVAAFPNEAEAKYLLDGAFGAGAFDKIAKANEPGVEEIRKQFAGCSSGDEERSTTKGVSSGSPRGFSLFASLGVAAVSGLWTFFY